MTRPRRVARRSFFERPARAPALEPMEPRQLLAGDALGAVGPAAVYVEIDDNGDLIAHLQDADGAWSSVDLEDATRDATFTNLPPALHAEASVDPNSGLVHITFATGEDLWSYSSYGGTEWRADFLDANTFSSGNGLATILRPRSIGTTWDPGPRIEGRYIVGTLDDTGDLIVHIRRDAYIAQLGRLSVWRQGENIGDELRRRGMVMPDLIADELIAYSPPWGVTTFLGIDEAGDLHAIWTDPTDNNRWRTDNLSTITGAPAYVGGLDVFVTPWSGINIVGVVASGDLVATWWTPAMGERWETDNFNEAFGFPQLRAETITGLSLPWGGLSVFGLDASGELTVFWWAPSFVRTNNDAWMSDSLEAEVAEPIRVTGRLESVYTARTREIQLFGESDEGAVRYAFDVARGVWLGERLGSGAGTLLAF